MGHLHILMLYIAGCSGLAVLALYYFYSLSNPSDLLYRFLRYQASLLAICVLNIFQIYIITDLGASPVVQEAYYLLSAGLASVFLYRMGVLAMGAARQSVAPVVVRAYALFCAALGASFVVPFFRSRDIETILAEQKWIDGYIVTLTMGIAIVAYAAFFFMKARDDGNRVRRSAALSALILNSLLTGIYILTVVVSPRPGYDEEGAYFIATDNFFFSWNLLALVFFFRRMPRALSAGHGAGKVGRAAPAPRDDGATERDWRRIEAALVGGEYYKESSVDLPALSRATGLPRNRVSMTVAAVTGMSFSEYLNSLRLAEFEKIVSAPGFSGNVLEAAFESGFNSKATFYNWIKKRTDTKPSEFVKRARIAPASTERGRSEAE